MNRDEIKSKMGMGSSSGDFYKLDKITMSGDDGSFKFTDLTTERQKGEKVVIKDIGKTVEGVILKMRWQLSRWDEPSSIFYNSTEYDDKNTDQVMVFPAKKRGSVSEMKEAFKLSTQRVIYFHVPSMEKIVRLVVKSSALSGDKNPKGEFGLFEHIDNFSNDGLLPLEAITKCVGVHRKGTNKDGSLNPRKDHYAMTFSRGEKLDENQIEKMVALLNEVDERTSKQAPMQNTTNEVEDEISPDDIPF